MNDGTTNLWRFNRTLGVWVLERACAEDTAGEWLARFQKDAPNAKFLLAKKRPVTKEERELKRMARQTRR